MIKKIVKFMSERFAKSFEDPDAFKEWADEVYITFVPGDEDRREHWRISMNRDVNTHTVYSMEEIKELENKADMEGYKIWVATRAFLVEKI